MCTNLLIVGILAINMDFFPSKIFSPEFTIFERTGISMIIPSNI